VNGTAYKTIPTRVNAALEEAAGREKIKYCMSILQI
jgi:hypothetical protein